MKEFLYYPGFEIEDEEWLKFALLYMKEIQTIVPYGADGYLSPEYLNLKGSTDLLKSHRPDYEEGMKASNETIGVCQYSCRI